MTIRSTNLNIRRVYQDGAEEQYEVISKLTRYYISFDGEEIILKGPGINEQLDPEDFPEASNLALSGFIILQLESGDLL